MKKSRSKRKAETASVPHSYLLSRFDSERYAELCPTLSVAVLPAHFEAWMTTPDLEETLMALEEGQATPETLRQEIVLAECCRDEPLIFDGALPRVVRELAQRPKTDTAALLLSELIAGKKNIAPWLRGNAGLLGILSPEDVQIVTTELHSLISRGYLGSRRGRKRRRGGLLGRLKGLWRGLFALPPSDEEMLFLLHDLLRDAALKREGLVLVAVN